MIWPVTVITLALICATCSGITSAYVMSPERVVFQTTYGDLEFALYPEVGTAARDHAAPRTSILTVRAER